MSVVVCAWACVGGCVCACLCVCVVVCFCASDCGSVFVILCECVSWRATVGTIEGVCVCQALWNAVERVDIIVISPLYCFLQPLEMGLQNRNQQSPNCGYRMSLCV